MRLSAAPSGGASAFQAFILNKGLGKIVGSTEKNKYPIRTMNKNMRYALKALFVGAVVLLAMRLFASNKYEGFKSCDAPNKKPNSEHECGAGFFCSSKNQSQKCMCCSPNPPPAPPAKK